ncbi:MAG: (d)CMP kinase [Robiginitomaculum sp.]|nr:(d)CMP kinase [Robiginitomaculum sp.]
MTIIAIDGTFSSGKGTLAKKLAAHYGFGYLDSGKLYRAVAHKALTDHIALDDNVACAKLAQTLISSDLNDPILKSGPVGEAASKVAVHPDVRAALLTFQQDFANKPAKPFKGAVLDGRDIGTVICPNADVKLYVDADPNIRAERRYKELLGYGESITYAEVLAQLSERDTRDMTRAKSPLKPANDAHLLDTSNLSIEAAFEAAKMVVDAVLNG